MTTDAHATTTGPKSASASAPSIRATVYVGRWPEFPSLFPGPETGTFPPCTSTIVSGPTEAVLIDAQYLKEDVRDLADLIERTGKTLTTIYVTHAHPDHYQGIGPLMERFPNAKCIALPHIVEDMKKNLETFAEQFGQMFGDRVVTSDALPEPFDGDTFFVDGSPLKIIEIEQADISPTTIVHIPAIDTVVTGDAIYNEIHPMLGLSSADDWPEWLGSVDVVESLKPRKIVAGHRRPDGDDYAVDTMIQQTRSYIKEFSSAYETAKDAEDLIGIMSAKFPHHGNLWTLAFSAHSAIGVRDAAGAPSGQ
ncbi:MBL fold metallo-hydrolase [Paenarthrobacter sp. CM16]|uniref:MBL fold metallo-hydrolase n=1 Tax=Paenarthrobacter sp. CM16 TaxID=2738447 RepID=UPI001552AC9F|nr:MBL fold metallo-hydrolase [Paenarthrobacter sp. CM16]NQD89509.1 MBL fold metallo-hydrolase [Paenarthrobacter sp. CM16]